MTNDHSASSRSNAGEDYELAQRLELLVAPEPLAPGSPKSARVNIARFRGFDHPQWALFPLLLLAGALGTLVARATLRTGLLLVAGIGLQIIFWLFTTHLQSRFLMPVLVPGAALFGADAIFAHHMRRRILALGRHVGIELEGMPLDAKGQPPLEMRHDLPEFQPADDAPGAHYVGDDIDRKARHLVHGNPPAGAASALSSISPPAACGDPSPIGDRPDAVRDRHNRDRRPPAGPLRADLPVCAVSPLTYASPLHHKGKQKRPAVSYSQSCRKDKAAAVRGGERTFFGCLPKYVRQRTG